MIPLLRKEGQGWLTTGSGDKKGGAGVVDSALGNAKCTIW